MNAKLMLGILGALIVVFFLSTGWGLFSDEYSVGRVTEALLQTVRGALQEEEPLRPSAITSADPGKCRDQFRRRQFTLGEGQSCRFDIGKASAPVRTLTLALQRRNQLHLRMIAGEENSMEQTETLPADNAENPRKIELQFVRQGGRLVMTCTRAADPQNECVINVL